MIDEVESNLIKSMLDFMFKKCAALSLIKQMEYLIKKNCNGCAISHPSQLQHTCISDTVTENANDYWSEAIATVCHGGILFEFLTRCEAEHLPVEQYDTIGALVNIEEEWNEDILLLVQIMASNPIFVK